MQQDEIKKNSKGKTQRVLRMLTVKNILECNINNLISQKYKFPYTE